MDVDFYRDALNKYGAGATLYHAAYRAANQITRVAVWNALVLTPEAVREPYRSDPRRAWGRLLAAEEMRRYAKDPASGLTMEFIDEAASRGDRCFALFEGEELASYGWYTTRPIPLREVSLSLTLHFDPSYVYLYNGYAIARHRGKVPVHEVSRG